MPDQVGKNATAKGTNQFMRQGHTSGPYGNNPAKKPRGQAAGQPTELKP